MKLLLNHKSYEATTGILMLLPGIGIILLCICVPILLALALSFTHCSSFLTIQWAGFDNYKQIYSDPLALKSLVNTIIFVVVFVPSNLILAFGVALLLNCNFRGIKIIRGIYFVPVAISMVVTASIFRFLYDSNVGPINALLKTMGFNAISWLSDSRFAMPSIILMSLWKSTAFFSIILLAALQNVPKTLHEAAMVDGAGVIRRFWMVTIPNLMPVVGVVITLSSIMAFKIFVPMFVLTQGGPEHATRSFVMYAYDTAFRDGRLGYSCAISFVLTVIILLVVLLLSRLRRKTA